MYDKVIRQFVPSILDECVHRPETSIRIMVINIARVASIIRLEPQADGLVYGPAHLANNITRISVYSRTEHGNLNGYYVSICLNEREKELRHLWIYEQTPLFPIQYAVLCHASCIACFTPLAYVCHCLILAPFASQYSTHLGTVSRTEWAHSQVVARRHTTRRPRLLAM